LSTRNKTDKEEKVREELAELKKKNPSARESMNDVMKEIGQMSRQDWLSIPDIGDRAYKKVASALGSKSERRSSRQFRTV
jgi:septation ring formation regulator EzrA